MGVRSWRNGRVVQLNILFVYVQLNCCTFSATARILAVYTIQFSTSRRAVALLVEHRTCDPQVVGSSPGRAPLRSGLWASYLHLRASVTKQYNLVQAKGQLYSSAVKVTAGLSESNNNNNSTLYKAQQHGESHYKGAGFMTK